MSSEYHEGFWKTIEQGVRGKARIHRRYMTWFLNPIYMFKT